MSNIAALADAFIDESVSNGSEPFRVAWVRSDTTYSINYLKDGVIDVALTYSPAAERIAIEQGIALSPSYYAWRDHFLIVGPPANPANISNASDIHTIFSDLHEAAEAADTTPPVRFLSRYDKSATNIKESELWISIGQVRRIFCFQLLWVWLKTDIAGSMGDRLFVREIRVVYGPFQLSREQASSRNKTFALEPLRGAQSGRTMADKGKGRGTTNISLSRSRL